MSGYIAENNQVVITGVFADDFLFSHETYNMKFYTVNVKVFRSVQGCDFVPVTLTDNFVDVAQNYIGLPVRITGQFRSYNQQTGDTFKLVLSVFAKEIVFLDDLLKEEHENRIQLLGTLCKEPVYRVTPLGKRITELLFAVNRSCKKTDYIPCICWEESAHYARHCAVGTTYVISGRIQSRNYIKRSDDGSCETKVAYEVSVKWLEEASDSLVHHIAH